MNWKECLIYKEMSKREGHLFRCAYDPETQIAFDKQWAGIWCDGNMEHCITILNDYIKKNPT